MQNASDGTVVCASGLREGAVCKRPSASVQATCERSIRSAAESVVQWVFDATEKAGPDGVPWFKFYRTERLVTCYYFYIHDLRTGAAFIKVCCYAPYPVKVWCNGHEIARRAALAEGIAVMPLANGFAATSDPARLQELCDLVQAGTVRVFFEPG